MTRSQRLFKIVCLSLAAAGMWIADASAQFYPVRHRPAEVEYLRFRSPHFRMIYETGLHAEAIETAGLLEDAYPEARSLIGLQRDLEVPVVLNHYTDRANGFVSPLPFRQEIEAVNLRGKTLSPQFQSWFEAVAPHELAHAVHAESGRGFGIGWILRRIGPDLARSLNLSGPRGINEGAAIWLESNFRPGAGRLNYSLFKMEFRAAMLSEAPWSLSQMLEPPAYTRPFDRYYNGGAHLFEFLAESGGAVDDGDAVHPSTGENGKGTLDFFRRARNFYYRFPLLGYGPALWYGTGMSPESLERRLHAHFRSEAMRFRDEIGPVTESEVVASEKGAAYRRPRWIDDDTIVAYVSGYAIRPGFYRIDAVTGERETISYEALTEDVHWTLTADRAAILFSRYEPSTFTPAESIAEVFHLDLATARVTRLTHGGRVFGAVAPNAGTLWALRNLTQFNEWVQLSSPPDPQEAGEAGRSETIAAFDRTSILAIEPIPGSDRVAILMNHGGTQGIYSTALGGVPQPDIDPLVVWEDANVFDVASSTDGRHLVLAADPGGVSNVYAYDIEAERLSKVTNVPFGAIEPSISPDGRWLAYVNYRHESYELVRIPFRPDEADPIEVPFPSSVATTNSHLPILRGETARPGAAEERPQHRAKGTISESEPYRPLANLRPRVLYPFLLYQRSTGDEDDTNLGFGVGLGLEWADPLQYWSAHTSLLFQHSELWGRLMLRSGHSVLRPSAEVFRSPSTVNVLMRSAGGRADTVRVGREERGLALGVRSPIVFGANVFQTHALVSMQGEYRQERLFDQENNTIRSADDRLSLSPSLNLSYRVQANPRDLVPNTGIQLSAVSKADLWAESGRPSRWLIAEASGHIPLLQEQNIGIQLNATLLTQNRGGIVDLTTFFPRGFETDNTFLGPGTFGKYGFEYTQPLVYIDDGVFLLPIYFKALFAYGFVETMQSLGGSSLAERFTVAGAGLGLQFRFAHSIDASLRVAPVYKFDAQEWGVTFR